jgi:hyperosmotically inducible protein
MSSKHLAILGTAKSCARQTNDFRIPKDFKCAALMLLVLGESIASAQSPSNTVLPTPATTTVPPDNSKTNTVDKYNSSGTADAQKQNASDVDLTSRIRKSVMADKSLSTYAHNIKIITVNGTVTLNGVVRTEQEKRSIDMKAQAIAGSDKVINDIKIAPSQP